MTNYRIDPTHVMHENIEGEIIVIHIDTGNYHSLRFVTADVWTLLDADYTTEKIIASLSEIYPQHTETISNDVSNLLKNLADEQLIQITDDVQASNEISIQAQEKGYTTPQLETYSDLQGLLLVDPIHDVADEGWPHKAD